MECPVQKVFEEISLQQNQSLWLSDDDRRRDERLKFFWNHLRTKFSEVLQKNGGELAKKNDNLSEKFRAKSLQLIEDGKKEQALACLDKALLFASNAKSKTISEQRLKVWNDINSTKNFPKKPEIRPTGFRDNVKVVEDPIKGRHLVAATDMEAGTEVAVDRPLLKILKKEYLKSHCWNCLGKIISLSVPCTDCTDIVFCCEQCAEIANINYHRFECTQIMVFYAASLEAWLLAFRGVVLSQDPNINKTLEWEKITNLVTHFDSDQFSAPELMKESLVATFIARWWFQSPQNSNNSTTSNELSLQLEVLRLLRIIRFNSHEVVSKATPGGDLKVIGFCINPLLALINHSCDSNYGRVWSTATGGCHTTVVAYVTRPIRKGEEICDSYGGSFARTSFEERREIHQRYHFECQCLACLNRWPTIEYINFSLSKSPDSSYRLGGKKKKTLLKKLQLMVAEAKSIDQWKNILTLAYELIRPPHAFLLEAEEKLHSLLWEQTL